jgi:hypothetical protein
VMVVFAAFGTPYYDLIHRGTRSQERGSAERGVRAQAAVHTPKRDIAAPTGSRGAAAPRHRSLRDKVEERDVNAELGR